MNKKWEMEKRIDGQKRIEEKCFKNNDRENITRKS